MLAPVECTAEALGRADTPTHRYVFGFLNKKTNIKRKKKKKEKKKKKKKEGAEKKKKKHKTVGILAADRRLGWQSLKTTGPFSKMLLSQLGSFVSRAPPQQQVGVEGLPLPSFIVGVLSH